MRHDPAPCMNCLIVTVHGTPAPQGSKRHVGHGVLIESSRAVRPWREAVRAETQRQITATGWTPPAGPVKLTATFRLARPRHHYGTGRNAARLKATAPTWVATRPDASKLLRAVEDALTDAGAWRDDAQVATVTVNKIYADDAPPGVTLEVTPL